MPPATTTSAKRTRRSSSKTDDAIAFLKSEHRDVEELFKRFEGLGDTAHKSRQTTVGKMIEALSKHAAIEEQVLYPAVRALVEGEQDDLILEALEEHHIVKLTFRELESMPSTDERYKAKVTVLTESVRHHVEEEEKELFPDVRKLFSRPSWWSWEHSCERRRSRLRHGLTHWPRTSRPPTSSPTRWPRHSTPRPRSPARPLRPSAASLPDRRRRAGASATGDERELATACQLETVRRLTLQGANETYPVPPGPVARPQCSRLVEDPGPTG